MNIICDNKTLRFTKYSPSETYYLDQITVFIERRYVDLKFYMIMKDCQGRLDVVYLKQVNSQNTNYYSYEVDMNTPVKIESGPCIISLFGVSPDTMEIEMSSNEAELKIENTIYNFKAQLSILKDFNESGAALYNKMLDLYYGVEHIAEVTADILKRMEANV